MDQYSYETIISCIKHGAPAIADKLLKSFNNIVELANQQIRDIQAKEQAEAKQRAEAAKTAKEQEKKK